MDSEYFKHTKLNLFLNFKEREVNSHINYSVTDEDGIILYANQNFCDVTGYNKEELIGVTHRIMNSGYHGKEFYKEMWDTIKAGYVWQGEVRNNTKSNKTIWFNTVIFPVFDKKQNVRRFLAIRTLINDKKKIEENQELRISSLKELIFKVSHELRQPITQLMGMTEILKLGDITNEETEFLVNQLKKAAILLDSYSRDISLHVEDMTSKEETTYLFKTTDF